MLVIRLCRVACGTGPPQTSLKATLEPSNTLSIYSSATCSHKSRLRSTHVQAPITLLRQSLLLLLEKSRMYPDPSCSSVHSCESQETCAQVTLEP